MNNLKLPWLADELRAAGVAVQETPGWQTRTNPTSNTFDPVGIVNHHTVGVGYTYPYTFLHDKCNLLIRPDGLVVTINAGYAYDSGLGTAVVLDRVRNDKPIAWDEIKNLSSNVNGNPYFVDIEVEHRGDGSLIPAAQYDALIATNRVLCAHYGWDPATRVIGHYEWAPDRKIDPYWRTAGTFAPKYTQMAVIRADSTLGGFVYALPADPTADPKSINLFQRLLNDAHGAGLTADGVWGPATSAAVAAVVGGDGDSLNPFQAKEFIKSLHFAWGPEILHGNDSHSTDFAVKEHTHPSGPHDHDAKYAKADHVHDEGVTGPPQ